MITVESSELIVKKHAELFKYIYSFTDPREIFVVLFTNILYLRKTLGFRVDTTEPLYNKIETVRSEFYTGLSDDELYKLLQQIVSLICIYMDKLDGLFDDDDENGPPLTKEQITITMIQYIMLE